MEHLDVLSDEEQELVRRGLAAASLLASPDFKDVIQSLAIESFARFTDTNLSQTEDREKIYNFYAGLKAIEAELNERFTIYKRIEDRLNAYQEPSEDI